MADMNGADDGRGSMEVDTTTNARIDGPPAVKKMRGEPEIQYAAAPPSESTITDLSSIDAPLERLLPIVAADTAPEEDLLNGMDEEEADDEASETKLYCMCRAHYDEERMMIACDRCDEWYHALCMNVKEEQAELVDMFICPKCEAETEQRTTWKPKCRQSECTHAALHPLSRYCSERCGVIAASQRIDGLRSKLGQGGTGRKSQNDKVWAERILGDERLQRARKRESLTVWTTTAATAKIEWVQATLGPETTAKIRAMAAKVLESPDESDLDHVLPQLEELSTIEKEKAEISKQIETVNVKLDLLATRTKILHLAEDRSALLEPARIDDLTDGKPSKTSKKSKSKKNSQETNAELPSRGQPRCGYDERLHWDDNRLHSWSLSEQGIAILAEQAPLDGQLDDVEMDETQTIAVPDLPSVCGSSKRKCKRHADWSVARGYDFDLERESQMRLLEALSNELRELETRTLLLIKQLRAAYFEEQQRRKKADEDLAQALALEGSRRAPIVS